MARVVTMGAMVMRPRPLLATAKSVPEALAGAVEAPITMAVADVAVPAGIGLFDT